MSNKDENEAGQAVEVNCLVSRLSSTELEEVISNGIDKFMKPFYVIVVMMFVVGTVVNFLPFWKDSTDPSFGRSGMEIKTDHLTGCQYLATRGGLTPRVDVNGNQICTATEED